MTEPGPAGAEDPRPDASTRRRAAALAGHLGDEPAARAALDDPDGDVRATALGAIARMGALRPVDLQAGLADGDAAVRRRAAEIAATHPDADLLGVLHDDDPTVVEVAAWACGEHERVSVEVLTRLVDLATGHTDALVREAAVAALGAIGDQAGLAAILSACADKPAVRRRAVLALASFDGDEVEDVLQRALHDRDWQVRQAAEDLLGWRADP